MFKINYVSRQPLKGDSPSVVINENIEKEYRVEFINDQNKIVKHIKSNEIVYGGIQYYKPWVIHIFHKDDLIWVNTFNAENKVIFIKIDSIALGDTIAWIPYVDEFMKKHKCKIICSTFFNELFVDVYPNILFVKPNTVIENVYAQYYVGASDTGNICYSPIKTSYHPLQKTATEILGLEYVEKRPTLEINVINSKPTIEGKYVCLSEYGSNPKKMWRGDWQKVVDYLNDRGYKVVVISKEKTSLKNIIDKTGDDILSNRMIDIFHSEFFIGISSGLSWLAFGLNVHVVMLSDVTPVFHEFGNNITRLSKNNLSFVNYDVNVFLSTENVLNHEYFQSL